MLGSEKGEYSSRFLGAALLSLLLGIAFLAPGAASADEPAPLTPTLATLATSTVAEASPAEQAAAVGLPAEGPGSLSRDGERVVVEAHFESGAIARLGALEEAGAEVMVASREYQTVALAVEPEDLAEVAEVPGVEIVVPSLRPIVYATEEPVPAAGGAEECEGGSVISKGVAQLNVPAAREAFNVDGDGVTVGVLSNSFNSATKTITGAEVATHARDDEESNDLPGPHSSCFGQHVPVNVIAEAPSSASAEERDDEGRAMLQVVHDVAPRAELAFATAYSSELEFARNIERLAEPVSKGGAGATVIVDDVAYYGEPFFQEGVVGNAIRKVTEEGVTYFTAAGNNNLIESASGNEIASWERVRFHDTACPGSLTSKVSKVKNAATSCLNFSPTNSSPDPTFGITVSPGATLNIDLQWAEAWYGVETDLNAYLIPPPGEEIVATTTKNVGGGFHQPYEFLTWKNKSASAAEVQLVIDRCIHSCNTAANVSTMPRVKLAVMENGSGVTSTEYPESDLDAGIIVGPTVFGHAGSAAAITVGAVKYTQSKTAPREPERYSSRGPSVHYFAPYTGPTAAAKLEKREVVEKPDLTATDCGATTFFAQQSSEKGVETWLFCGTSEAAPHAAAVAALMQQFEIAERGGALAAPTEIGDAMTGTATAFTTVDACQAVGGGMLNADAALTALAGAREAEEESGEPAEPEGAAECESELGPEEETEERITEQEQEEAEEKLAEEKAAQEKVAAEKAAEEKAAAERAAEEKAAEERRAAEERERLLTPTPTAPTVKIISGPATVGNQSRPTFEFSASHPSNFTCQLDGGAPVPCTSPYVVPTALTDGPHGFAVTARDAEGLSGTSAVYEFTVDTKAPRARIVSHPNKLVKTRGAEYRAKFRLSADASPVIYYCQIDREPLRICGPDPSYKLAPGKHVLKVRVKDELGNLSITPSTFHFRVKQLPR